MSQRIDMVSLKHRVAELMPSSGRCPKCGARRWSTWMYVQFIDKLRRFCNGCGYMQDTLPLDRQPSGWRGE